MNKPIKLSKADMLKSGGIPKLVLTFAASTLAALILNAVYNLTDALFVSWGVGDNAMGGVSVVFPFVILQGAISTAVGGGAASIVSRKLGAGKSDEAGEVTLNAMAVFYITAALVSVIGFVVMEPMLRLMGVTADIYPYAKQYFIIILAGNIFSTGFSSIIRAEGKMLYGLLIWVIPITINIVLDAIFILVLGWGVRGSAAATVICQFTSFMMMIIFFTRFSTLNFKGAKLRLKRIGEVLAIGLPSLVQMGSLSLTSLILNNVLSGAGGTLAVNSFAYMLKIITFAVMPFTAITQALAPIVGFNHGAGDKKRVQKTVVFCVFLSVFYAFFALILVEIVPNYMIMIFTSDAVLINIAAKGLRIVAVSLLFTPLPLLLGAALQAVGKKLSALFFYASSFLLLLPFVFTLPTRFGVDGVWWSYVAAALGASLFALTALLIMQCKNKKTGVKYDGGSNLQYQRINTENEVE